ncbi:MAG: response regulator [Opitutaceae bacterium]|jgi:CheY-like chemotaxis protein
MKTILYVEDSAMSQMLMRRYVGDAGKLTICTTLDAAAAQIKESRFDLLITDYMFPEGDSLDLIVGTRRRFSAQELPIIVVSGSMDRLLLSRILKAGANDGFSKPLKAGSFNEVVTRMLAHPYVRSPEHGAIDVHCFRWMNEGLYYQFCPDLGLTTSGPTKEAASAQMIAALQAGAAAGAVLGNTSHHGTASHIIELPGSAKQR